MVTIEAFLEHHGIKGQKWGIRHDPVTGQVSEDHRKVAELRKKPVHSLTNQDLQSVNNRLNLERNFRNLNPNTVKKGRDFTKEIVATATLATSLISIANSESGKRLIKKGSDHIRRTIFGKAGFH